MQTPDWMHTDAVVALDDVSLSLNRQLVFRSVSLEISRASVVSVRGFNGSGKTSLLRLLCGVCAPTTGTRFGPDSCAYVPAAITAPRLRAREWIDFMPRSRRTNPKEILEILGFRGDLQASCRQLSFGNLRKLILADALSSQEQFVAIDDASAGLDDRGLAGLASLCQEIAQSGTSVVLADQDSAVLDPSRHVVRISDGCVSG